jgi:hypothetical protein
MEKEEFISFGNGIFFYESNVTTIPELAYIKFGKALSRFVEEREVQILSVVPLIPYPNCSVFIVIVNPFIGDAK